MNKYAMIRVLFLSTVICSCRTSTETVVGPPVPVGLITNPSFEFNGNPSLADWTARDTFSTQLVKTAPEGGGSWSLRMEATWFPASFVETTVPMPAGLHRYQFSLWGKHAFRVRGGADLSLKRDGALSQLKSIQVADTSWTLYAILDTLTTMLQDSMVIRLSGGGTENAAGETFIDLCRFEWLE